MATVWSITERSRGNVLILHAAVRGLSVDSGRDRHRLLTSIQGHLRQGNTTLLVNLCDAAYLDSDGLGEIVRGYTLAAKAGGILAVCELVSRIRDLFRITRLNAQIPTYATEQDGLDALYSSIAAR